MIGVALVRNVNFRSKDVALESVSANGHGLSKEINRMLKLKKAVKLGHSGDGGLVVATNVERNPLDAHQRILQTEYVDELFALESFHIRADIISIEY